MIARQALHRTDVASVAELNVKIRAFVTGWNHRAHPFVWTKTSPKILKKDNRPTTLNTDHWSRAGPSVSYWILFVGTPLVMRWP